jgi:hypothetical protein
MTIQSHFNNFKSFRARAEGSNRTAWATEWGMVAGYSASSGPRWGPLPGRLGHRLRQRLRHRTALSRPRRTLWPAPNLANLKDSHTSQAAAMRERGGEVTRTTHKLSGRRPSAGQPTAEPPSHHYDSEFSPEKSSVPRFFPFGSARRENNSHEPSFKWFLLEPQRFGPADSHCECQDAPRARLAKRGALPSPAACMGQGQGQTTVRRSQADAGCSGQTSHDMAAAHDPQPALCEARSAA